MTYTPTNCEFCKRLLKTENGFNNHKCPQKNKPKAPTTYKCEFCKKTFKTEGGMTKHMCFRKIRWMNKESQETRIATSIWTLFREIIRMPIKSGSSHDIVLIQTTNFQDSGFSFLLNIWSNGQLKFTGPCKFHWINKKKA